MFQFPERHFLASTLQQVTLCSQHSVASSFLSSAPCSRKPSRPLKAASTLQPDFDDMSTQMSTL